MDEPASPPVKPTETSAPSVKKAGGLYADGEAALKKVQEIYEGWTGQLTQRSFELSLAVIAANWAVFGGLNAVLHNQCAKFSIAVVVLGLGITLVFTWIMGEKLRERINFAEANATRWAAECEEFRGKVHPWPFSTEIDCLAVWLRRIKTFGPLLGGALFFIALFL